MFYRFKLILFAVSLTFLLSACPSKNEGASPAPLEHSATKKDNLTDTPLEYSVYNYDNVTVFNVTTPNQLVSLSKIGKTFSGKTIILANDIDMSDITGFKGFKGQFRGVFDGNNKKIINMVIDISATDIGLFALIEEEGEIRNLNLEGGSVTGSMQGGYISVGGIASYNLGKIMNVSASCVVMGNSYDENAFVGGITGFNKGTIINASNSATVTGIGDRDTYVGGIAGWNDESSVITNASNSGNVTGSSKADSHVAFVGGITGYGSFGKINNAYNIGNVTGGSKSIVYVGGITGENNTEETINNVYNIGNLKVTDGTPYIGGIVGSDKGAFNKAYYLNNIKVCKVGVPKNADNFTISPLAFDPDMWEDKIFEGAGIINGVAKRAVLKGFKF